MIVHELKSGVSTVRIHDECYEADSKHLINSASRVVSESYKRRVLWESKSPSIVAVALEPQSIIASQQA